MPANWLNMWSGLSDDELGLLAWGFMYLGDFLTHSNKEVVLWNAEKKNIQIQKNAFMKSKSIC